MPNLAIIFLFASILLSKYLLAGQVITCHAPKIFFTTNNAQNKLFFGYEYNKEVLAVHEESIKIRQGTDDKNSMQLVTVNGSLLDDIKKITFAIPSRELLNTIDHDDKELTYETFVSVNGVDINFSRHMVCRVSLLDH